MALDLVNYEKKARLAVKAFWGFFGDWRVIRGRV